MNINNKIGCLLYRWFDMEAGDPEAGRGSRMGGVGSSLLVTLLFLWYRVAFLNKLGEGGHGGSGELPTTSESIYPGNKG
ncbi:MAG: hypothetical protein KJ831_11375 [Candidatus Eisenbacteria bacterium]|nr:hypothetical protein [Candidatus Eisenbacteria bacterium]